MNILCCICQDALNVLNSKGETGTNASALPCGHVFHTTCSTQWFATAGTATRSTCPQCRTAFLKTKAVKLFWDVVPTELEDDPSCIKAVNDCLKRENQDLKDRLQAAKNKADQASKISQTLRENVISLEAKLSAASLNDRILSITRQKLNSKTKELENLKDEIEKLRKNNESMRACNTVMNGNLESSEERDAFEMMSKEQITMLCLNFRKDGKHLEKKYESVRRDLMKSQSEKRELQKKLEANVAEMSILTNVLDAYKRKANKIPRTGEPGSTPRPSQGSALSSRPVLEYADSLLSDCDVVEVEDSPPRKVPRVITPRAPPMRHHGAAISCTTVEDGSKRPTCSVLRKRNDGATVDNPSRPVRSLFSSQPAKPLLHPESYDGLGGHSRLDDFPKPKITSDRKLFKATHTAKK